MVPVPPGHEKCGQKQRIYGLKSRLGFLFAFDITANECLNSLFLNPKHNGELHLVRPSPEIPTISYPSRTQEIDLLGMQNYLLLQALPTQ